MTRGECEALLEHGIAEASKATTPAGEYAAWVSVVAQRIDVLTDAWKPPRGLIQLLAKHHESLKANQRSAGNSTEISRRAGKPGEHRVHVSTDQTPRGSLSTTMALSNGGRANSGTLGKDDTSVSPSSD